ncbi:MAG: hypothetical protein NZT92_19245 [Abditibacteriales bacterium]|nr:hypothetical protein [Abditibacteriales bacterium]
MAFKGRRKHLARQRKIHGHQKRRERNRKMAEHDRKIEAIVRDLRARWEAAQSASVSQ